MALLVRLRPHESFLARIVGYRRWDSSVARGSKHKRGLQQKDARLSWDIEGAAGEMAAAKALNLYWSGSVDVKKELPDIGQVGDNYQVRTTDRLDGSLIVAQDDPDDQRFILVVGKIPRYRVVGWILGADAKQAKFLRNPGNREPAYFVPQNSLHKFQVRG